MKKIYITIVTALAFIAVTPAFAQTSKCSCKPTHRKAKPKVEAYSKPSPQPMAPAQQPAPVTNNYVDNSSVTNNYIVPVSPVVEKETVVSKRRTEIQVDGSYGRGTINRGYDRGPAVNGSVKVLLPLSHNTYFNVGVGTTYVRNTVNAPSNQLVDKTMVMVPVGIGVKFGWNDMISMGVDALPSYYFNNDGVDQRSFGVGFSPELAVTVMTNKHLSLGVLGKYQFLPSANKRDSWPRETYAGAGFVVRFH